MAIPDSDQTKNQVSLFGYNETNNKWYAVSVGSDGSLILENEVVSDTPEFFEDTSFVSGDSPATLDINTALGRNATVVTVINDGPGEFTVATSTDGAVFGDDITIKQRERWTFRDIDIDSVRITHVADSAYRVTAI